MGAKFSPRTVTDNRLSILVVGLGFVSFVP